MSGEQLKTCVERTGISHARLQEKMGVTSQTYFQWLKAADVKSGILEKFCTALGVDMTFFYPTGNRLVNDYVDAAGSTGAIINKSPNAVASVDGNNAMLTKMLDEMLTLQKELRELRGKYEK